jgi:adenylosuccinate lyase
VPFNKQLNNDYFKRIECYIAKTEDMKQDYFAGSFFSEEALIKYRVLVEIEYFIALCECLYSTWRAHSDLFESLRNIYKNFSTEDALWIKETEKVTNHDVKA